MGNRRMGLARMEALLEAVDRDLDLTNSTLTAPTIVDAVSITSAGAVTCALGDITATNGNMVITAADHGIIHTATGTVTQASNHTTAVTLNATSGKITLAAAALAAATNAEFTFTNSALNTTSVVLVSIEDNNTTDNASLTVSVHTIADGSCKINLHNPAATGATSATASKVHFLIVNATQQS